MLLAHSWFTDSFCPIIAGIKIWTPGCQMFVFWKMAMFICSFRKSKAQTLAEDQIKKWWGSCCTPATFLLHSEWALQGPSRHRRKQSLLRNHEPTLQSLISRYNFNSLGYTYLSANSHRSPEIILFPVYHNWIYWSVDISPNSWGPLAKNYWDPA